MKRRTTILLLAAAVLAGCGGRQEGTSVPAEDKEAKAMLQGVWVDPESGERFIRVVGDTIFYADSTSMPAYFRIVSDSIELVSGTKYGIVKQTPHLFWFNNQNGDLVKLEKSEEPDSETAFVHDQPKVLAYTHQVKRDSVVMYNGERYHWYVAINPTKYKVSKRAYNDEGVEVENVYYDNIMHISVFQGSRRLYSSDFRKSQFAGKVPDDFLSQAILGDMEFSHIDAEGLHFDATICIPDAASCYMVETTVSLKGEMSMKLMEY